MRGPLTFPNILLKVWNQVSSSIYFEHYHGNYKIWTLIIILQWNNFFLNMWPSLIFNPVLISFSFIYIGLVKDHEYAQTLFNYFSVLIEGNLFLPLLIQIHLHEIIRWALGILSQLLYLYIQTTKFKINYYIWSKERVYKFKFFVYLWNTLISTIYELSGQLIYGL